jgi:hypothetical protein
MRTLATAILVLLLAAGLWAQAAPPDDSAQLRHELEQMKKTIVALEQRLAAQEKVQANALAPSKETVSVTELATDLKDVKEQVNETQRKTLLDRIQWSGDYRFQAHTLRANIPAHYDGMQVQNFMTKMLWMAAPTSMGGLGGPTGYTPAQMQAFMSQLSAFGGPITPAMFADMFKNPANPMNPFNMAGNTAAYSAFANNPALFAHMQSQLGNFNPQSMRALQTYLAQAAGITPQRNADTNALFTNRLRLRFNAKVADNVTFDGRISMYKVFGDSVGVQTFDGRPTSMNIDGTTTRVPNGDMLRVERAFFSWNHIGGSNLYLSIGRRPSTDGPPLNFREDEPRGGTPTGSLFNYQYDGITLGYHLTDKMTARLCWGVGFSSGFGSANQIKDPASRIKDVHLLGAMVDLIETENTFVQVLAAHAWNVTDGFNGEVVWPVNPLTGEAVPPAVMRFTPSANLGALNLFGINLQRKFGGFDLFLSGNASQMRPNGLYGPFGGLGSDPFETPTDHTGTMIYAGVRYSFPQNDGKTKLGLEFNHGSKYWFNFSQAEDDIFMPKTATRGEVFEPYITHRINDHLILKAAYQHFNYRWSGSGWHVGTPKPLDTGTPQLLGFPSYDSADLFTVGLTARF